MSTREFHYQDDTSSKFWRITLSQEAYTVQFGKIGTAGQIQTKTFPDEQSAQAASDKLIAEKLKKGYREVVAEHSNSQHTGETPAPSFLRNLVAAVPALLRNLGAMAPANAKQNTAAPQVEPVVATPRAGPALQPAVAAIYDPTLRLNLDPIDWFWATWRRPTPLQRPAAAPFDRADALRRLRRLSTSMYHWHWKWETTIPEVVSPEEALFWLQALYATAEQDPSTSIRDRITSATLADRLATSDVSSTNLRKQAFKIVLGRHYATQPVMMALLVPLFSPKEIMAQMMEAFKEPLHAQSYWYGNVFHSLLAGFRRYVLPYLSQRERDQLSQMLTPYLKQAQWPSRYQEAGHPAFYFAAVLGGHATTLQRIVQGWADDTYSAHQGNDSYQHPQEIIFGLDDPREVEAQFRRLQLRLSEPGYVRAWLAHTEDRALDVVRAAIQGETEREAAAALMRSFALVASPLAAPHMLLLTQESKAPYVASAWIDEHPAHTIAGLLPLADGRGAQSEAATEMLRRLVRRGYRDMIEQALAGLSQEVATRQYASVIEGAQPGLPPFDDQTTPSWLAEALRASMKGKQAQLPAWARISDLPPVVIGGHVLNVEQMSGLLRAVQKGRNGAEHPLIQSVKQHADQASLDRVIWNLFERWLAEGAPSKDTWALFGLGLLGGDSIALKLVPLIRVWPGQSQHQRAVNGLECLRMIGSDTALMQINGIAQKVKFKGLQNRAVECMDHIAEERGLSRAQLEDRIVPDCDLDARGERLFDFGSRQFRFVLGPEMKPMVRDPQGKLKPNLPAPTTKDDAEKAAQAIADWKLLKKQVAEVASVQAVRLEQAMVTGRRWTLAEFETLLVRHPLMTHLVRALIWGVYDRQGALSMTFRVTEDQSYADSADEAVNLPADAAVGLIHPLHLHGDDRAAWGEILSDYEIVQPFPQLGRAIQRLEAHELHATDIKRFDGLAIPSATLVFGLDKLGWTRDLPADGGGFCGHFKPFYQCGITAVIQYSDGVAPGWIVDAGDQKINYVAFVPGIRKAEYWPTHKDRLVLGEVDPVVISEVLNDILFLAAKAK